MTYKRECKVLPPKSYDWVTQEMFNTKLRQILDREQASLLLGIPGIFEIVSEEFNNEILAELEEEREDQ